MRVDRGDGTCQDPLAKAWHALVGPELGCSRVGSERRERTRAGQLVLRAFGLCRLRRKQLTRFVLLALSLGAAASTVAEFRSAPAYAAQGLPTDVGVYSWYITANNATTSWAYARGWEEGQARQKDLSNSEVILDFGSQVPNQNETRLPFHNGTISYSQTEAMAEQFAYGYYEGTGSDSTTILRLAVGSSNDNVDGMYNDLTNAYDGGFTWSQVVRTAYNWVQTNGYGSQVNVWGGSDMETEFGGQTATLAWDNGYTSNSNAVSYLDYGDAGGCSQTSYSSGNGYSCNGGWNQYGVWDKSWGVRLAFPQPEIYHQANADQWWNISRYGYYEQSSEALTFQGPLDEHDLDGSTNTSTEAWDDLSNDLERDSHTNIAMTYSDQIHHD